jgi:acetyl-CoA carboxylase biotin carboxyl carrier protein
VSADRPQVTIADLRKVIKAFEDSDWDEVHLESAGVSIHLGVAGHCGSHGLADVPAVSGATPAAAAQGAVTGSAAPTTVAEPVVPDAARPAAPPAVNVPALAAPDDATLVQVCAPMRGVFWSAPSPGAPAFVEVGAAVQPDTTIGIVEVMKLMTPVKAGIEGWVEQVLVANAARVSDGQPLITVRPL